MNWPLDLIDKIAIADVPYPGVSNTLLIEEGQQIDFEAAWEIHMLVERELLARKDVLAALEMQEE